MVAGYFGLTAPPWWTQKPEANLDFNGKSIGSLGNLTPTGDAAQNLGTAAKRWSEAYIRDITAGNSISVTGAFLVGTAAVSAGNPTTADFSASRWGLHYNSSSDVISLVYNRGGTLKTVTLA